MAEYEVNNRIKALRKHTGLTQGDFAIKIGVSTTTISEVLLNKKGAGMNVIQGIISAFRDISTDWLLTGTGDMLKPDFSSLKEEGPEVNLELEKAYWEIESLQKRIEKQDEHYTKIIEELKGEIREIKIENKELIRENGSLENQVSTLNRELDNLRKR